MNNIQQNRTLVIIPTLGQRVEGLLKTLKSVAAAGQCYCVVVTTEPQRVRTIIQESSFEQKSEVIADNGEGIHRAINMVLKRELVNYEFITWINDDDRLAADAVRSLETLLDQHTEASAVYGDCSYINEYGKVIWTNRFGQLATKLMWFGPDLIPQPGSLIRSDALIKCGLPDPKFGQAFDFELFLRIHRNYGPVIYANRLVSYFGWHTKSETVEFRWRSAIMAAKARKSNAQSILQKFIVHFMNPLVIFATYMAGKALTRRS